VALVSVPLTCSVSTAVLALHPVPVVLLLAETARKVVSYSFAKPAREMLFTQLSEDVKYKSKLVLDTVVQRGGDALGAALFSVLGAPPPPCMCARRDAPPSLAPSHSPRTCMRGMRWEPRCDDSGAAVQTRTMCRHRG
jgi:hypothetical protein